MALFLIISLIPLTVSVTAIIVNNVSTRVRMSESEGGIHLYETQRTTIQPLPLPLPLLEHQH